MALIVSILGNKGGTGKTTLSHMLGQGFGIHGVRAVVAVTDSSREPLSKRGRRYLPSDARRPEQLEKIARTLRNVDGWVAVIDGAGGHPELDDRLAELSDLVLLPFRDSHEDIRTVLKDLERLPRARALPAQWPTNPWARDAANRTLAEHMGGLGGRLLPPVFALSATKLLLHAEIPDVLPSQLNHACGSLAQCVAGIARIPLPEEHHGIPRQGLVAAPQHAVAAGAQHAGA